MAAHAVEAATESQGCVAAGCIKNGKTAMSLLLARLSGVQNFLRAHGGCRGHQLGAFARRFRRVLCPDRGGRLFRHRHARREGGSTVTGTAAVTPPFWPQSHLGGRLLPALRGTTAAEFA